MDSHVTQHPIHTSEFGRFGIGRFRCATGDLGYTFMFNVISYNLLSPLCPCSRILVPPLYSICRSWESVVSWHGNKPHTSEERCVFCWFSKQTCFFKVVVRSDARGGWGWEQTRLKHLLLVVTYCDTGVKVMWCYISVYFLLSLSPKFAVSLYLAQDARHKGSET